MKTAIPLDRMSTEEKLQTMESIWEDLCKKADEVASPSWHKTVLDLRSDAVRDGDDEFTDWETAKKSIRTELP